MADEGPKTATDGPEKGGRGRSVALVLSVVGLILLCLAASQYRYFIPHERNIWSTEVGENMDKIRAGAWKYYATDHWDSNGNLLPKAFPSNITRTPKKGPHCDSRLTPTEVWDIHGWGPIHFALTGPHSFAYEFRSDGATGTAASYTARALRRS